MRDTNQAQFDQYALTYAVAEATIRRLDAYYREKQQAYQTRLAMFRQLQSDLSLLQQKTHPTAAAHELIKAQIDQLMHAIETFQLPDVPNEYTYKTLRQLQEHTCSQMQHQTRMLLSQLAQAHQN